MILTKAFEEDAKVTLICSSGKYHGRPKMRRKVVVIATVESDTKQEFKEDLNDYVGFKTVFTLYRSKDAYYLQVSGVSSCPQLFPQRNKVIEFETPEACMQIVEDKEDKRLYWSPLLERLIDEALTSEYLTEVEKHNWELSLIDEE